MIRPVVAVVLLASLGACNDPRPPAQPTAGKTSERPKSRTVLQFLEDSAALDDAWARCRNDPGGSATPPIAGTPASPRSGS